MQTRQFQTASEEISMRSRGYKFIQKLGQGSYAKVYLGEFNIQTNPEDTPRVTLLACKVIDSTKSRKEFVAKFLKREIDIVLKVKHPHIIHMHSLFQRKHKYYIFMRYAENGDLLSFILKHGPIAENQARIWARQLGLALQYLHALEIGHRDIKCENVLVTQNYNVKIADFGFARPLLDDRGNSVLSRTYCGSFQYAAPEILKGTPYNPKLSDVWAYGVVLYTTLNKSMPFDDDNSKSLYQSQLKRRWKFRSKVVDKLSRECKELVKTMLEPDISQRATIDEIVSSHWIAMDMRLRVMKSDEQTALSRAVEHTQKVRGKKIELIPLSEYSDGTIEIKKSVDHTFGLGSKITSTSTVRRITQETRRSQRSYSTQR